MSVEQSIRLILSAWDLLTASPTAPSSGLG